MPAQSQQQQKLFGLALAFKRGEVPASEVSDEIKDIADRMSEKDIEDFASTKHKGLPKMKEQLRKIVREIMREQSISEMELSKDDMEKLHSDGEVDVDGEKVTYDESVNEGASTEEKRIVMMAIKKIAKYRNVPLDYAVGDVIRAAEELERTIKK
mgnify:CR=1